jgi:hypothetical protein
MVTRHPPGFRPQGGALEALRRWRPWKHGGDWSPGSPRRDICRSSRVPATDPAMDSAARKVSPQGREVAVPSGPRVPVQPQTSPLSHLSPALRKESVTSSSAKGNLSHVQGRSKREDLRWDSVSLLVSLAINWEPCTPLCPSCSEARIRALTVKMGVTGRWHVKGKPSV